MKITPYILNAKKHPKKQVEQVANSIKEFGMNQPIVVDKQGVIIVGHGRYEALQSLGMEIKDEYIKVVDLTEEQAKAYRLADNKLNESDWDMNLVMEELKGLSEDMLELTGFDSDLIIEADEKDDEVPETPEEPKSKLGDLYELGGHRVLCGDSTKIGGVEMLMDGKKADMVFTDPPYGVNYEGIKNDDREGLEDLLRSVFTNYLANSKSGASIYCFHSDRCADIFNRLFREFFHFSSMIIWVKNSLTLSQTDYQSQHEPCLYGWMDNGTHSFYGDRKQTSIWKSDKERVAGHTTPKPIEIVTKAVANSSKGEDIVLDLFLGSGSTLIASEKTGRICYGMELDPKYIDVIVQRYVDYTGNDKIKKNGKDIIWQKKK